LKNLASNIFILDSSAFYAGFYRSLYSKFYTTTFILQEIKHLLKSSITLDFLISTGALVIQDPTKESVDKIIYTANISGDIKKLSHADISIISLAYQLSRTLISDDYSVLNVSNLLKIKTISLSNGGIVTLRKWKNFCKTCNKQYAPNIKECEICGNATKRNYKKFHAPS
jgi:endoribonuclease Nob1